MADSHDRADRADRSSLSPTRETGERDALAALEATWRARATEPMSEQYGDFVRAAIKRCADDLAAYRRATRAKETRA